MSARVLKLNELKEDKLVWLERSNHISVHPVKITDVKIGENYFNQKCLKIDFSEPWSEQFTFIPPGDDYHDYGISWQCWTEEPTKKERNTFKLA